MKKVILLALLVSSQVFAAQQRVYTVNCSLDRKIDEVNNKPVSTKFSFQMTGLEKGKLSYEYNKEDGPVEMSPKESVLDLNENEGIELTSKGIELSSDGDGCQWTTVLLYKDRDYKKGYARVKGDSGCGAGSYYSPITCEIY